MICNLIDILNKIKDNVETYLYYNNKNKWFDIKSADIDVIRAQDVRFLFFKSILSASV
tara:strand:+ start:708 stop:881 length:174 start_codon:yes stop_codon:yes gene_type:complete